MDLTVTTNKHIRSGTGQGIPLKRIDDLNAQKKKLAEASKGLESFFLYYVLKAMRKTVPENGGAAEMGLGAGIGKDVYTQIFDEELAKKMAGNGDRSIASMLYRSLERVLEKQNGVAPVSDGIKDVFPKANYIKIQSDTGKAIKIEKQELSSDESRSKNPNLINHDTAALSQKAAVNNSQQVNSADSEKTAGNKTGPISVEKNQAAVPAKPIASSYKEIIQNASERYRLNPALLESIISTESNGNPRAVSPAGAKGLMQLADTTASDMGVKDVFDPEENIHGGARYLRQLIDRFQDIKKALAAYNAGPEKVARYEGIPPYRETRNYVKTIIDSLPQGTTYYE
ncbi:putative Flagellar rod assembly protein FlgJ [Candidatus Zixiibacteriota bacterium]|nr:putative Flagellar rod assembly protein FlgJ [candidate division Zixibacteria bacterium]